MGEEWVVEEKKTEKHIQPKSISKCLSFPFISKTKKKKKGGVVGVVRRHLNIYDRTVSAILLSFL